MKIANLAAGALGLGAAGFVGRGIVRYRREMQLEAMEEQYKRMASWRDPDIENAINELKAMDFSKLYKR